MLHFVQHPGLITSTLFNPHHLATCPSAPTFMLCKSLLRVTAERCGCGGCYRSFFSFFCLTVAVVSPRRPLLWVPLYAPEGHHLPFWGGVQFQTGELTGSWDKLIKFSFITERETEARRTELDGDGIPLKITCCLASELTALLGPHSWFSFVQLVTYCFFSSRWGLFFFF